MYLQFLQPVVALMNLEGVMYLLMNSPRIKREGSDDYVRESEGAG
jgi:hypothetical protein